MNRNILIDALVRQMMVFIAQLATSGAQRTPMAQIADQVFLRLCDELKKQGVSTKVIADMFGLSLSTYHDKVRRLRHSETLVGRTLWEAIYTYISEQDGASRIQILFRFRFDDETVIKSVLRDLVDSGVASRSGRGENAIYRLCVIDQQSPESALEKFIWLQIDIHKPLTPEALYSLVNIEPSRIDNILTALCSDERVVLDAQGRLTTEGLTIAAADTGGWEAAVFDHFQAMVTAIIAKLQLPIHSDDINPLIGGSTYHIDISRTNPAYPDVIGLFGRFREEISQLKERVAQLESTLAQSSDQQTVTFYFGQNITQEEP